MYKDIKIYETASAGELVDAVGVDYPQLAEDWQSMRQIGFRDEPLDYSVVSVLRKAVGDDSAEVYSLGNHYLGFTTNAFSASIEGRSRFHRVAITKSPCAVD